MEMEHLRAAIANLVEELNARNDQMAKAEARAAKAQSDMHAAKERVQEVLTAIDLLESISQGTATRPESTADFVSEVLKEAGVPMRDSDILAAIQDRGWTSDSTDQLAVLRTILSRMMKDHKIVRTKPRMYRINPTAIRDDEDSHDEPPGVSLSPGLNFPGSWEGRERGA